jgi:hypothetical protein
MPVVSGAELQTLSDWMGTNLLTDTCAIQREVANVWTTVSGLGAVPCAVTGASYTGPMPQEWLGADLKTILMPRNTDVRSPDRLVINSINYRVFDVKDPSTFEVLRRVIAARFPQRGGAL